MAKEMTVEKVEATIPGLSGKTATIILPATEENKHAQPGCINGIAFNIPRGKAVEVPVEVLGVLNDANIPQLAQDGTELGRLNRFNAQVLSA